MLSAIIYALLFAYALMNGQTMTDGAVAGVRLAAFVVIPSLFPLIFLSSLANQSIFSKELKFLYPLEKLCGMPSGSGVLLLLGLLGGYPIGVKTIADTYEQGAISREDANRLLGFCNNAGPSFIFGMVGGVLKDIKLCWLLWIGQILSAIVVGIVLPGKSTQSCKLQAKENGTITQCLEHTMGICMKIAGWIVIFRSILSVLDKIWLTHLPSIWSAVGSGILELSNGCVRLGVIESIYYRYLICGVMLCFGGLCVHLQTKSVIGCLSIKHYMAGKLLQTMTILPILIILWKITVAF